MGQFSLDRRGLIRALGGITAAGAGGVAVLTLGSEPAVAATGLTASDVTVSSNDGDLTTLTIAPDVTVDWSGQETAVSQVDMTWKASTSANQGTVGTATATVSSPSKDGSISTTSDTMNLLGANGGPLAASNFGASTDGGSATRDVTIWMNVTLVDDGGNTVASADQVLNGTYAVTVNNEDSTVTSSGTANTGGS